MNSSGLSEVIHNNDTNTITITAIVNLVIKYLFELFRRKYSLKSKLSRLNQILKIYSVILTLLESVFKLL